VPQPLSIPIGRANCLAWGDDGALWLGSDRGIGRWDGRDLAQFDWSGERENQITALLVHHGQLYVGSHAGLWIADVERMGTRSRADIEAHGLRLGLLEGIPNAHVTRLVAHHDAVWVATMGGLAALQ
jgi:ligand-binding sensor domain-containing protein